MDLTYTDLPNKSLLLWTEVAVFLRVSKATVYRLRDEGKIEGVPVKGGIRFFRESVIAYLDEQKNKS
jgi:excisionase family DNA binding protein